MLREKTGIYKNCVKFFLSLIVIYFQVNKVYGVNLKLCNRLGKWECDDGQCIERGRLCDGNADCTDSSDEIAENCIHLAALCKENTFRCTYGACILKHLKCNGIKNCADNSDESPLLCATNKSQIENLMKGNCGLAGFQCKSGECISDKNKCDGKSDCRDNSDESVEVCSAMHCPFHSFRCGYGACISSNSICDFAVDCFDASDESAQLCNRPRRRFSEYTKLNGTFISEINPLQTTPSNILLQSNADNNLCQIPQNPSLITRFQATNEIISLPIASVNTVVTFSCLKGLILLGRNRTFCGRNGWNDEIPICTNYCHRNTQILNGLSTIATCIIDGQIKNCWKIDWILPGTNILINCEDFFTPSQSFATNELKCLPNGSWSENRKKCDMQCGVIEHQSTAFTKGGDAVNSTEVPWNVGIYSNFSVESFEQICAGTIISPRVIISAAHCFWDVLNNKIHYFGNFKVIAGKININSEAHEQHTLESDVKEIYIPDKYNNLHFLNDFAILFLIKPLKFSIYIRPICLFPREYANKDMPSNENGYFSGWNSEGEQKGLLQVVGMKTLSFIDCKIELYKTFQDYELQSDKFCLPNNLNITACRGDSGSGFFLRKMEEKFVQPRFKYYLEGVISHSPFKSQCAKIGGIVVVTNVQYYMDKIEEYYKKDKLDF